ncbi:MAG: ABC transporter ATP-binding protein [Clostridia bacterium]|nr:ABC transporter ATP-binding protein [Clostridia bacterium]
MIEIRSLVKKYGETFAINGIDLTLADKGVHAVLGPKGSGKSALLDVISGYVPATEGEVLIGGECLCDRPIELKKRVAYLPQELVLYEEMTPFEYLLFIGEAKRVSGDKLYKRVKSVLDLTRISEIADTAIKSLTPAEKKLLGVAQCMLGNPDIIVLDSPMASLGEESRVQLSALIKRLGELKCVIVSTDTLSDVYDICDDMAIISNGELVVFDSMQNLEAKLVKTKAILLSVRGPEDTVLAAIKDVPGISACIVNSASGGVISMKLEYDAKAEIRGSLFAALAKLSCPILSMAERTLTLSDVYTQLVATEPKHEAPTKSDKKRSGRGGRRQ